MTDIKSSGAFLVQPEGDVLQGELRQGVQHGQGSLALKTGRQLFGSGTAARLHGSSVLAPPRGHSSTRSILQQYEHGKLTTEHYLQPGSREAFSTRSAMSSSPMVQEYHSKPGDKICKGHASYQLMRQLQLGILCSIAQTGQSCSASNQLSEAAFKETISRYFPASSSSQPFRWKDYAPRVFHDLRLFFGIDDREYLASLAEETALRELPTPGKSGSIFLISEDDRYLLKTIGHEEMRLILKLIPVYYVHIQQNPQTLLVHFYGVHRVSPLFGFQARFTVMGNVLPSTLRLHRKYDLKGSTWDRTVGEKCRRHDPYATLKDLDLDMQLVLLAEDHNRILQQLDCDSRLLEDLGVIDYSLLLGVHFKITTYLYALQRWGDTFWSPPCSSWPLNTSDIEGRSIPVFLDMPNGNNSEQRQLDMVEAQAESSPVHGGQHLSVVSPTGGGNADVSNLLSPEGPCINRCSILESLQGETSAQKSCSNLDGRSETEKGRTVDRSRFWSCFSGSSSSHSNTNIVTQSEACATREGNPCMRRTAGSAAPPSEIGRHALGQSNHVYSSVNKSRTHKGVGHGISAMAIRDTGSCSPEPVLIWFGIIDFLQNYTLRKKIEHAWKSAVQDATAVSAVSPKAYRKRFMMTIQKLFKAAD